MALMLASRICQAPAIKRSFIKQLPARAFTRTYANEGRDALAREARRKATLKEKAMAPAGETAFSLGKGAVAGASVVGIGALCYYGVASGHGASTLDQAHMWPQYVKDRIKTTYMYFGSSIAVTAASAAAAFRSPAVMNLVTRNGFIGIAVSLAAIIGTGMLAQGIEYSPGFGPKQMAWILHASVMGAMIAPLCILGGPILIRAAWYTAGVVGGLSTIAVCAPSDKFLYMGGPLAMGLGVVFCSSIGSMFLPPTTALGAGLYSISLYGGLLLFSAFLLYDTQRIIAQAERYPMNPELHGVRPYDPINSSISIYLDTLNIFIRIVTMLAMGGNQRRK
ncbi:growth hormone-inducible transmembrane protein-like isoform X1 [Sitophilus oryzae]|uniref:Growth hormone-inducible transmembrane protein-like isoform X1 n=1 Tax=Sitophilus oryzae TaxID=7048 RepID=A0A6J2Y9K8_SITOR|nr:growth hormone-inducible transmembrane protein-like isoform X1 [Sitophilus oryzae]XP_030760166.1 growth hormone-inducible transmembrane protein-like isoform X1 [Sitophilus oryzae]XP_030760172.1 growth hormone-inducible transmembrane protein-like isoform X1 [Sitophilus oryzae]XP_030760181.1 growth hormone-inducible transmembrane protein-like isoform X1 [Sitophilus oryzae]XP_030760190.1 growth hormone-inducible transmembrane protein-like isoform X1 [Sitophilus oryzae]